MKPRFTPEKFEELINRRGRLIKWERGNRCPCQDAKRLSAEENCILCEGSGFVYTSQGEFKAVITSLLGKHKYTGFGDWISGDSVMTFAADKDVGDRDRITVNNAEERESDVLRKGKRDFLLEATITRIIEVRDRDRTYTEGLDFDRNNRNIVWKGIAPTDGAPYSVLYFYRPTYIVWLNLPQNRAVVTRTVTDGSTIEKRMPKKVALRRWRDFVNPGTSGIV